MSTFGVWVQGKSPPETLVGEAEFKSLFNISEINLKSYGAVGDGVTDDTAAVIAADDLGKKIFVPDGTYDVTLADTDLDGPYYGSGQIRTVANNKRAPFYSAIKAAPSSLGNHDSPITAFNGDISQVQFPIEHRITGAATLGQPTGSDYEYTPEAYPHYTYLYTSSGWNDSTSGNGGRTAACAYHTRVVNAGQGDAVAYNAIVFVTGTLAGSTHFLANPAGVLFNGGITAGAAGVYMNPYETACSDGGYDVACVGLVNNFDRTVGTGAKSAVWLGYRAQNIGSTECDAVVSATGKWKNGLDLTMSTLDANLSAVSLKATQRIYFNNTAAASGNTGANWFTTTYGGEWLAYNSSVGETQFFGQSTAQFAVGRVASAVNYLQAAGAPTGALPSLYAKGSDTNVSMGYISKGTGSHIFYGSGGSAVEFAIACPASAVNYMEAVGAIAGSASIFRAAGSDTNIDMALTPKGTGTLKFGTHSALVAETVTGYITIKDSGGTTRKIAVVS